MTDTINVTIGSDTINVTVGTDAINVTVTGGTASAGYVASDSLLSFEGDGGDSGLKYNTTTQKMEMYVNGTKKASWG